MATIRDVALQAGVSVTTVSHVVNGTRPVEPETTRRVRSAIRELGYRPNLLARGLRRRVTHTLGLLVPDNSNPFFADVARAIEDVGFSRGYSVILCNSDLSEDKQETYVEVLLSKQVDGILLIASGDRPEPVERITSAGVPVVVVDREVGDLAVDQVLVDNELGGYQAGKYLAELGHTEIGCIAGPSDVTPSAGRIAGFRRALSESGLELKPDPLVRGDGRYAGGEAAMCALLERWPRLTAVFAFNDLMAIGGLAALRRLGRSVPEDVSLLGFDDIQQASAVAPPLTTVSQPAQQLGQVSVELLLQRILSPGTPPSRVVLPTALVVRESCRAIQPERDTEMRWQRATGAAG